MYWTQHTVWSTILRRQQGGIDEAHRIGHGRCSWACSLCNRHQMLNHGRRSRFARSCPLRRAVRRISCRASSSSNSASSLASRSSLRIAQGLEARSAHRLSPSLTPTATRFWQAAHRIRLRPRSIPSLATTRREILRRSSPSEFLRMCSSFHRRAASRQPRTWLQPPRRGLARLTFSSVGVGTATHLSAERFRISAGIDALHVPFKGGAEAMSEVIAGRVDFFFGPPALVGPHVRDGKLLALAVNGTARTPSLAEVPTTRETRLHGRRISNLVRALRSGEDAA